MMTYPVESAQARWRGNAGLGVDDDGEIERWVMWQAKIMA
jgi:hypothetical protein